MLENRMSAPARLETPQAQRADSVLRALTRQEAADLPSRLFPEPCLHVRAILRKQFRMAG